MVMKMDGIIVVNKEKGMTSHDVVNIARKALHTKKVGHAGTLDPDATGVLVLAVNKATKALQFLAADIKEYKAVLSLGIATDSYDRSGRIIDQKEFTGYTNLEKTIESFRGDSLIFNIQKLEGVFVDGIISQAPAKKNQDPFRIHTGLAGRNESGAITFKDALLTTSKEEYPLWSIRASRLWILPGNEMAFFNGFLSVGVVPIMYFPFFYYPADEMLFHPVFGFKNREGAFVQTTTYILGRKPAPKSDEATSFSNFMQSDTVKKQKLEGLFFKKLDEPASDTGGSYLKLIADAYSGLGYLTGLEGKFTPQKGYVKQIDFHGFLGFSYTLYPRTGLLFSQYGDPGKEKAINKANLFGTIVPFRYNFSFNVSMTKSPFNVSVLFPFISDPFFKKDFMGRSEDMNWFKYFLNKDKLAAAEDTTLENFYSWKVDGSINPSFSVLKPWISYMSLEAFSGKLNFESKKNESLSGNDALYAPDRLFYYPKNILPELRAGLGGTIFSTSMLSQKKERKRKQEERSNMQVHTLHHTPSSCFLTFLSF